jgi:WD40 repeat protein
LFFNNSMFRDFRRITTLAIIAAAPAILTAQTAKWSTPTLGYLYDSDSKAIRVLSGIPGAASLDGGLSVPDKLEQAAISPNGKYAIAAIKDSGSLSLITWSTDAVTSATLDGTPASADLVAFSNSSAVAAILSRDAQTIQIWTGLPDQPFLARQVAAVDLSTLAVSDDGALLAGANTSSVFLIGGDQPKLIANGGPYALTFLKDSHDLAIADQTADQISLLTEPDCDVKTQALAGSADGVAQVAALAVSGDGAVLVAANLRGKSVLTIDLTSKLSTLTQCDCQAEGLYRAQGNAVFRLTNSLDNPISVFDGDTGPRVVIIPAGGAQ